MVPVLSVIGIYCLNPITSSKKAYVFPDVFSINTIWIIRAKSPVKLSAPRLSVN
ncbi:unnamed protein product [Medioppia subpectinata]|uniref:Uncharacterized protein n=1 Tax=Medioppia subpectinata TaxID=1979941 RepID=A0A7R9LU78_9ACAR|nr:unnamed protein product [Medioppia subpectinata]CAG2121743.1 unnamed protein product [Medioppia subpectinata]